MRQGDGYAIELDGTDDYVDCTASKRHDITGPVAAWVKPTRKADGAAMAVEEIGFGGKVETLSKPIRGNVTLKHQTPGRSFAVFQIAPR